MQKTKDANDSPKIFSNQRKQSRCGLVFDLHFAPKEHLFIERNIIF